MLKIVRTVERDRVVFTLSGRIEAVHAADLQAACDEAKDPVVLDLKEVTLVDRDVVECLKRWESGGVVLRNCPPYVREWIECGRSRC